MKRIVGAVLGGVLLFHGFFAPLAARAEVQPSDLPSSAAIEAELGVRVEDSSTSRFRSRSPRGEVRPSTCDRRMHAGMRSGVTRTFQTDAGYMSVSVGEWRNERSVRAAVRSTARYMRQCPRVVINFQGYRYTYQYRRVAVTPRGDLWWKARIGDEGGSQVERCHSGHDGRTLITACIMGFVLDGLPNMTKIRVIRLWATGLQSTAARVAATRSREPDYYRYFATSRWRGYSGYCVSLEYTDDAPSGFIAQQPTPPFPISKRFLGDKLRPVTWNRRTLWSGPHLKDMAFRPSDGQLLVLTDRGSERFTLPRVSKRHFKRACTRPSPDLN